MENKPDKIYVEEYLTTFDVDMINTPYDKFIEDVIGYKKHLTILYPNHKDFILTCEYDEIQICGFRLETDTEYKFRVNKESADREKKYRQYLKLQKELGLDQ